MRTPSLVLASLLLVACGASPAASDSPADGGWQVLFDGRSLAGWVQTGGRYDGEAAWTVEGGALTGREGPGGEGGLIYTERAYRDFELELDVRLIYPFDSGVFVRMRPPATGLKGAQVTIDHRPGGEVGAIYADGFLAHNEWGAEALRKDDWNTFRVRCTGHPMHLQAWLNGRLLSDHEITDPTGYAAEGLIGLQVHGGEDPSAGALAQFRHIRIREL